MRKLTVIMLIAAVLLLCAVSCAKKQESAPAATAPAAPATQSQTTTAQTEGIGAAEEKPAEPAPAAETAAPAAQTETPAAEAAPAETASTETAAAAAASSETREIKIPETLVDQFSYAFGVYCCIYYGDDTAEQAFDVYRVYRYYEMNREFGMMGIQDTIRDEFLFTLDEMTEFLTEYDAIWTEKLLELNLQAANEFLAENAKKEGVVTTESGLQYLVVKQGDGAKAKKTDSVNLDYELKLLNGEIIDSSYERGESSTFPMDGVIEGFAEGVMLMPMGSHYIFYIHPNLGYADMDLDGSGGNQLLIFEVETHSIAK